MESLVHKAEKDAEAAYIKNAANNSVYKESGNNMVVVKDIEFYSLCEHHGLPFAGRCHVAYVPDGKIIGLSKIPYIVDMYSRKPQLQERLTRQIANAMQKILRPKGVAVVMEARHSCMTAENQRDTERIGNGKVLTDCMTGCFSDDGIMTEKFLSFVNSGSRIVRDSIIIKGLKAECFIGVTEQERSHKQSLEVDARLYTDLRNAARKDDLKLTVNYDSAASAIKSTLSNRKFMLIEAAAEDIAEALLERFKISSVRINVKKPKGLYIKNAYCGVEIQRSRGG